MVYIPTQSSRQSSCFFVPHTHRLLPPPTAAESLFNFEFATFSPFPSPPSHFLRFANFSRSPLPNESFAAHHTRIYLIHDILQHQVALTREFTKRQQMCIERHKHEIVYLKDLHQMALAQQMQREEELEKVKEVMRHTNGMVRMGEGEEGSNDARGEMKCEGCEEGKEEYGHSEAGEFADERGGDDVLEVMEVMPPRMVPRMRDMGMETAEKDGNVMVEVRQEEQEKQDEQDEGKQGEKAGMGQGDNDNTVTVNSPEHQQQQKQEQPEEVAPEEDKVIVILGSPQHQKLEQLVGTDLENDHGLITLDSPQQLQKEPARMLGPEDDHGTVTLDSPQQQEQQQEQDPVEMDPKTDNPAVPDYQETTSHSAPNTPINLGESPSTGVVPSCAAPSESSATFPVMLEDDEPTQTQSLQKENEEPSPPMSPTHQPANISWKASVLEECLICQEYHNHDHYIQHMCGSSENRRCAYIQELRISKKINGAIKGKAGDDNSNGSNDSNIVKDSNSVNNSSSDSNDTVNSNNTSADDSTSKNSSLANNNSSSIDGSNTTSPTDSTSISLLKAHSKAATAALGISDPSLHIAPSLEKLSATFHKESDAVNDMPSRPSLTVDPGEGKHGGGGVKKILSCRRWRK